MASCRRPRSTTSRRSPGTSTRKHDSDRHPADGPRHSVVHGGDARVPDARPRRSARVRGAGRRDAAQLRGDRGALAADRHHPCAGRRAAGAARTRRARRRRHAELDAVHQGRGRGPCRARRDAHRRHPAGAAVLVVERAEVQRRGARGAAARRHVRGGGVVPRAPAAARRVRRTRAGRRAAPRRARRLHGAQPAGARHRGRRPLRGRSRRDRARRRGTRRRHEVRAGVPERGTHARAVDRSEPHPDARRAIRQRRPQVPDRPDRVRLRPHGDPVRHRRPGRARGARILDLAAADRIAEHLPHLHRAARGFGTLDGMTDVVIVGGGIAGLATAYELHRRGIAFVVLERGARAGGVILSETVDGFVLDGGPDALLIQKPDGIKLCEELGIGDRLVPTKLPRLAYIQRGGTLHALPAASVLGIPTQWGPFIKTRLFSWPGKIRMGMELFVPPRRDDRDESIGSFMSRRFGREAETYLAEPLLAGIHAGDVDRLSIKALFPRFVEAEQKHGSLLKAFRPKPSLHGPHSGTRNPDGAFKSLPGGLSELVEALVKVLPADSIRLNTAVARISGHGPYVVECEDGGRLEARAVVLATPAFATAAIARDLDPELARACGDIPYASAATVALAFRRDQVAHPLNGSGFVVPRVEKT